MNNVLIGKKIVAMYLAEDKQALKFDIEGADALVVRTDGDCCSHTWIEHLEIPALGFPALVTAVEDLDMNKDPDETDGDYVQFYGCKISTDRGEIVIDYRNSSNGYYGGSLSWPDDKYYYGGVHGQNVSKEEWRKVA